MKSTVTRIVCALLAAVMTIGVFAVEPIEAEASSTTDENFIVYDITLKNKSGGVKITWNKASSATGYYLYRKKTDHGSYKKIKTIKNGSTTSYTDTGVKNKDGIMYTYKIVPYNSNGKGNPGSDIIIRLKGTKLTGVTNTGSKKAVVKWKKGDKLSGSSVTGAGYQIQYSTSKSFTKGSKTKTVTVSSMSKTKKTLSSLKKGKTYYVRIRRYEKYNYNKYYSAWSSAKKVKIKK